MLFRCQETGEPVTICTTKEMIVSASKYRTVLAMRSIRYAAKRDAEPAYWPCALTHWLGWVRTLTVEPPGPAARVVPAAPGSLRRSRRVTQRSMRRSSPTAPLRIVSSAWVASPPVDLAMMAPRSVCSTSLSMSMRATTSLMSTRSSTASTSTCSMTSLRSTCLSNAFRSTCLSSAFRSTCLSGVFTSICLSGVFTSTRSSNALRSTSLSGALRSTCLSRALRSTCLSGVFTSTRSSSALRSTIWSSALMSTAWTTMSMSRSATR